MKARLIALLIVALVAAGAAAVDGERAFRGGRFAEAHAAFAHAVAGAGDEVPAELLWNEALATLAAGRLRRPASRRPRSAPGRPHRVRLRLHGSRTAAAPRTTTVAWGRRPHHDPLIRPRRAGHPRERARWCS
ncbi:MAG: hypothetical protein ACF8XB_00585 [Planctomycetota bacterium JB042]